MMAKSSRSKDEFWARDFPGIFESRSDWEYIEGPDLSVGGDYSRLINITAVMDKYSWMKVEQQPIRRALANMDAICYNSHEVKRELSSKLPLIQSVWILAIRVLLVAHTICCGSEVARQSDRRDWSCLGLDVDPFFGASINLRAIMGHIVIIWYIYIYLYI